MVGGRIKVLAESMRDEVTGLRHHFHRHPETAWGEVGTSDKIEALLREWGFENIRRGFRGTRSGVVADLNAGGEGPSIAPVSYTHLDVYKRQLPDRSHDQVHRDQGTLLRPQRDR